MTYDDMTARGGSFSTRACRRDRTPMELHDSEPGHRYWRCPVCGRTER